MNNQTLLNISRERILSRIPKDSQLTNSLPSPTLTDELTACEHSIEVVSQICKTYGERPALGYRSFEIVNDKDGRRRRKYLPKFTTLSFRDLWNRIVAVSSGCRSDSPTIQPGDKVGILGFASVDFVVAEQSCLYLGAISVPLQANYGAREMIDVLADAEISTLICSIDELNLICKVLPECAGVRHLIIMDAELQDEEHRARVASCRELLKSYQPVHLLKDLEEQGRRRGATPCDTPKKSSDPIRTLGYTSGSSGTPKGAIFTESHWIERWRSANSKVFEGMPLITLNILPMNHLAGRTSVMNTLKHGGTLYFPLANDMSTLFEDIQLVRPTYLSFVPRVADTIYQHFQLELAKQSQTADQLMEQMRATFLGDRLFGMQSSSAPIALEVKTFLQNCFAVPVFEVFGSTECSFMTFDSKVLPVVTDFRLVDVPELGYRSTDKPFPRGELYVKTKRAVAGYYKNPEATRALFDEKGYIKTGDIVEQRAPDTLVWLERKSNVMKLAQGEFVQISKLETILQNGSPLIKQVYLYGNSKRSYLLAVIVPESSVAEEELLPDLKSKVQREIARVAKENDLRAYEIPRSFILEMEPFSLTNRLLTGPGKLARGQAKAKYGERLESLYNELESTRAKGVAELGNFAEKGSLSEQIKGALTAVLGISDLDLSGAQSFRELGGDSVNAVALKGLIQKIFNVSLSAGSILGPNGTLKGISEEITALINQENKSPTFATVHGPSANKISRADLTLDKFFDAADLQPADGGVRLSLPPTTKNFLLTGANGFLGRFLCLELLEKAKESGGKVWCLIRAKPGQDAAKKLSDVYESDPELKLRFAELSKNNLVVVAGDIEKFHFGLNAAHYQQLASEIDVIFHSAALVNHAMSYENLFESNVVGTAEILKFALAGRSKYINYLSTLAVAFNYSATLKIFESDANLLEHTWDISSTSYARGYTISKWAGEVLSHNVFKKFGVPVNVFRADMILPHSRFRAQINEDDYFIRIICSLINAKTRPSSFYARGDGPAEPHFDGLPVDFVAAAIAAIGTSRFSGYSNYHVSNIHWNDRISLDKFVDWIQSAGFNLEQIAEYDNWYLQFANKLRDLTAHQQRFSILPIIQQWQKQKDPSDRQNIDAQRFQEMVKKLKPGGLSDIPQLDERYFKKCLSDLVGLGMIEAKS